MGSARKGDLTLFHLVKLFIVAPRHQLAWAVLALGWHSI